MTSRSPAEQLRELARKASKGPWTLGRAQDGETYDGEWWPQVWPHGGGPVADFNRNPGNKPKDAANAAYIARLSPDLASALADLWDAAEAFANSVPDQHSTFMDHQAISAALARLNAIWAPSDEPR